MRLEARRLLELAAMLSSHSMLLIALAMSACMDGIQSGGMNEPPADAAAPPSETDFDRQMMEIAIGYRSFPKINTQAYTSTLGAFEINVYATGDVRRYRDIHPETTGSGVTLAIGTVIVREVLDGSGQISKLTVVGKGPSGYDPTLGDWWFGAADPMGTPLVDGGVLQHGRVEACHSCHIPRANDDYMFGVPKALETGHP
jgi:hypothetical protein